MRHNALGPESTADFRPAGELAGRLRRPCGLRRACGRTSDRSPVGPKARLQSVQLQAQRNVHVADLPVCAEAWLWSPWNLTRLIQINLPASSPQGPRNLPAIEPAVRPAARKSAVDSGPYWEVHWQWCALKLVWQSRRPMIGMNPLLPQIRSTLCRW